MSRSHVSGTELEHRSAWEAVNPRVVLLIAVVALTVSVLMVSQGAAHDALHDARHLAGVACH